MEAMIMVFGEERLFKTNDQPKNESEFYLRFLGEDSIGLKMRGVLPNLWKAISNQVIGPQLMDEDRIYNITGVDYNKKYVWLIPV